MNSVTQDILEFVQRKVKYTEFHIDSNNYLTAVSELEAQWVNNCIRVSVWEQEFKKSRELFMNTLKILGKLAVERKPPYLM